MSITLTPTTSSTLVSIDRLVQNEQLSALNTSNPALVASLLAAATTAIQKETKRLLFLTTYSEYLSGGNYPNDLLYLKEFPVIGITRVASNPQTAMIVTNTATSQNQRATIATTATGVTLYRMASGTPTTSTLLFSDYPTLTALATAINGLGNGWSASVQGAFALFPSADLRPLQGAYTAINGGANLEIYTEDINGPFSMNDGCSWGGNYGWRLDAGAAILTGRFPHGHFNIRVDYTAGFATIPDDLQEACLQLVLDFYNAQAANNSIKSERVGPYSYENNAMAAFMSPKVRAVCSYYKDRGKLNMHV